MCLSSGIHRFGLLGSAVPGLSINLKGFCRLFKPFSSCLNETPFLWSQFVFDYRAIRSISLQVES